MTDRFEFCDCYQLSHHSDEYVPYPCDFCEKMERAFMEEKDEKENETFDLKEPGDTANY